MWLPRSKCSPPRSARLQDEDFQFIMTAKCNADNIYFFGNPDLRVSKEKAAMVIVCLDMVMVIFYWMSLVCVKPFVDLTENEIISKNFFASDFTV
jgi:hypothetical protein